MNKQDMKLLRFIQETLQQREKLILNNWLNYVKILMEPI